LAVQSVPTLLPSKRTVMGPGAKPRPLTAALLPAGPALGVRPMAGVMPKMAEAEFALLSDAVTM
jgi:hypothetical protein